jgi:hypothetical protein
VGINVVKTNFNDGSKQTGNVHVKGTNGTQVGLTFNMSTGMGELVIDTDTLQQAIIQSSGDSSAAV